MSGGPEEFAETAGQRIRPALERGIVERTCMWLCQISIVGMVAIIALELVTRNLLGFSFHLSDELGGYLLAAISFFSLAVCQTNGAFHRVEFVQARLSPAGQAGLRAFFDVLCFAFAAILVWQLVGLEMVSVATQERAPTILTTPLWIVQITLPLGAVALAYAVGKSFVRDVRAMLAAMRGTA